MIPAWMPILPSPPGRLLAAAMRSKWKQRTSDPYSGNMMGQDSIFPGSLNRSQWLNCYNNTLCMMIFHPLQGYFSSFLVPPKATSLLQLAFYLSLSHCYVMQQQYDNILSKVYLNKPVQYLWWLKQPTCAELCPFLSITFIGAKCAELLSLSSLYTFILWDIQCHIIVTFVILPSKNCYCLAITFIFFAITKHLK